MTSLGSDNLLYRNIPMREIKLLARELDHLEISYRCVRLSHDGYEIMIRGMRCGDVDISVRLPAVRYWSPVFYNSAGALCFYSETLTDSVVLPDLQKALLLDDLATNGTNRTN